MGESAKNQTGRGPWKETTQPNTQLMQEKRAQLFALRTTVCKLVFKGSCYLQVHLSRVTRAQWL